MSKKNKLKRFEEMKSFENVFQNSSFQDPQIVGKNGKEFQFKGRWRERCYDNSHPLVLELACGGGEYSVELAKRYPEKNFLGIDIKGARIYKGAKQALEEGIGNVAFLRTRIELINQFFTPEEVSEIWITFPDPFPKHKDINNRLTSEIFLQRYLPLIEEGGLLHLKTDSLSLFQFSLNTIAAMPHCKIQEHIRDVHESENREKFDLDILTHYERIHLSNEKSIMYLKVCINR